MNKGKKGSKINKHIWKGLNWAFKIKKKEFSVIAGHKFGLILLLKHTYEIYWEMIF